MKREDFKVGMKLVIEVNKIVAPNQRTKDLHAEHGYVYVVELVGNGVYVDGGTYIASGELQYCKPYKASYKEGDRFRVVAVNGHSFKIGDVVVLAHDGGTRMPDFRRESDGLAQYVRYSDLEFIEEIKGESEMQSRFKVGDKVRVKAGLEHCKMYGVDTYVSSMLNDTHGIQIIHSVQGSIGEERYRLQDCTYNYTNEMLDPVIQTLKDVPPVKGMKVRVNLEGAEVGEYSQAIYSQVGRDDDAVTLGLLKQDVVFEVGRVDLKNCFSVGAVPYVSLIDEAMYPYLEVVEMPKPKRTELKQGVKYKVDGREIYWLGVDSKGHYVFGEGLHHTVSDKSHHMDFINAQIGYLNFLDKDEALELEEA